MEKIKNLLTLQGLKFWHKVVVYYFAFSLFFMIVLEAPVWFRLLELLNLMVAWYFTTTFDFGEEDEDDDDDV